MYHRSTIVLTIGMQLLVAIVVGGALLVGGATVDSLLFWLVLSAMMLTSILLNLTLIDLLLAPLRDLSMAITNMAGQKPTHPLANPNHPRYAKNGFQPMLQYLYDSASADDTHGKSEGTASSKNELVELALGQTNAGVVVLNGLGEILYANRAAPIVEDTQGVKQLELIFEKSDEFVSWLASVKGKAVRADRSWSRIPTRIVGDPERRIFDITAHYENGSNAEVVLIAYDATNVYRPEDDELDFISFAAHELRGPITVIRGYIDVLQMELGDVVTGDQKELFSRLTVSANRLSGYINNILNTSKYDRRHLQVHLAEDSIAGIYDMIRDDMALRASAQHRMISVNFPPDLPTIAADRSSLSEVLSNLIDNALKYSNEGGVVTVTAATEGQSVKVSVADNGIGMPANVVGNLFHKFYRSHRSRETVAGTGIGLYLCKAIVESHGGKIEVSSTEGVGSTFSFTVPTYASVADKLQANDFTNQGIISTNSGWIKNHTKFSG